MPNRALGDVLLILSPFLVAPVAAWLVSRRPAALGLLALWPALLTVVLGAEMLEVIREGPRLVVWPWVPSLGLVLSFQLDGLGLLFGWLITAVGTLVVIYSGRYLNGRAHAGRFVAALFAFMGAMLGVALSDNLFSLFVFWELTGFTSFLLIGFEHERAEARSAALQALIVTGGGGLALLAAAILIGQTAGTLSLSALAASGGIAATDPFYAVLVGLVLLAAFTKSAQVPFHFWLPAAMTAPTPVSAYLHSATMVKAGVYLVLRMTPILGESALWDTVVVVTGAVTMIGGAWRALQETDLKRVLAYSTISALGVLMLLIGLGTAAAVTAALVYLVAHACYKGALFLVAGALEHETGTRDVRALGGLGPTMPMTATAAVLAAASMAGLPLFLGFLGKEGLYSALLHDGSGLTAGVVALVAAVVSSVALGLVALKAGVWPFAGRQPSAAAHEAPMAMWGPPLVLGVAGAVVGVAPGLLAAPLGAAAASVLGEPITVSLSVWHGLTPVLFLSLATLSAIAFSATRRAALDRLTGPRSLGTAWLYTGPVALVDAISRSISPALQSASLRSYVLAIVVTAGVFIGTAVATGGAIRTFAIATDVHLHEVLIVALIIAGAISAARATSSMAAVLSLGAVGWGVALMFLSFGAPDLAMTQFSVETLTVVIFVLVFRHFPRFGQLSPRIIRVRDAVIAASFGSLIAALVLFVGTSGVPSRLSAYFVEHGPLAGHGRNIVNLILVDFRAFDTIGEITVLACAAIGVRALLRLGTDRPASRRKRAAQDRNA